LRLHKGDYNEKNIRPVINSETLDHLDHSGEQLHMDIQEEAEESKEPLSSLEELIGKTFLMDLPDGERHRARIVELIEKHDDLINNNPERIKFLCSLDQDGREELLTYNQVLDYLNKDLENPIVWKFKRIVSHQGPLKPHDKQYKGSLYNVMIEWEGGEVTAEPLNIIAKDDPVTCAIYAKENNLLDCDGWKRFKSLARRQKNFIRTAKQAYLRSFRSSPKYKYGYEVPRNYQDAMRLDRFNGNSKWRDATKLELDQINEYETFNDLGHKERVKAPVGFKKIRVHLIFDVKHDGRHKARLVADGHLTDAPLESVYSGVVSIRGFRIIMFLAELNHLEFWATDVGNAYLESFTTEKVYIIAGPEFGEYENHIMTIRKALYGLKSSGQRWHDRLHDCLQDLGFNPCKAEPDIWMKRNGDIWEYIAVYVDDLAIAMRDPNTLI
jgi:Reverse transcriptase (RNA-dependent DNA polymerase)